MFSSALWSLFAATAPRRAMLTYHSWPKLTAATMSEVRPQLLITLVHGTWPRGLFPKIARFKQWVRGLMRRKRLGPPPFWFEEGSPFLARLSPELCDIPHKIKALPWSGANSIFIRDKIAVELAEDLSAEHAEHPQATQLIIAHSHGGNIALRALHHLKEHSVAQAANPLIVALATPFIEVQHADFGSAPSLVRAAVGLALWTPVWVLTQAFFPLNWNEFGKSWLVSGAVMLVFFWAYFVLVFQKSGSTKTQSRRSAENRYAIGRNSVGSSSTIVDNQSDRRRSVISSSLQHDC